jgi:hypothetical protein
MTFGEWWESQPGVSGRGIGEMMEAHDIWTAAVAAERERCAAIIEKWAAFHERVEAAGGFGGGPASYYCRHLAAHTRAGGTGPATDICSCG